MYGLRRKRNIRQQQKRIIENNRVMMNTKFRKKDYSKRGTKFSYCRTE